MRYFNLRKPARLLILVIVSVFSLGCSQHKELSSALEDYHQRLASILDAEPVELAFIAQIDFPAKQSLYQKPQDVTFNVREFYALPDCRLNTLIAERNTGLGKTQLPSQRFVYETDLLSALRECISLGDDERVKAKLSEVLNVKQNQYADSYANLVQTSDEVFLSFTQSNGFISGDASDGYQETRLALQYIAAIADPSQGDISVTSEQLESSLKDLNQFRLNARLWRSQQLLSEWFELSTPWLDTHTKQLSCKGRLDQQKAKYLQNVFMMFFADKIQPIASQLNHYHYQLEPTMNEFVNNEDLAPAWRNAVNQQKNQQHLRYTAAIKRHILVWQALFKRCGLSPMQKQS